MRETPTPATFVAAARRFADEAGMLTDDLRAVVADVERTGGAASMAMLGETVFALDTGLTDAGYDPAVCEAHPPVPGSSTTPRTAAHACTGDDTSTTRGTRRPEEFSRDDADGRSSDDADGRSSDDADGRSSGDADDDVDRTEDRDRHG